MLRDRPVTAFASGDTINWTLCVPSVSKLGSTHFVFPLHYVERRLSIYGVSFRALIISCVVFIQSVFLLCLWMNSERMWDQRLV